LSTADRDDRVGACGLRLTDQKFEFAQFVAPAPQAINVFPFDVDFGAA
jgi:hypothetical protein